MNILAIDPGNVESGYCVLDENLKPTVFGKIENEKLIDIVGISANLQYEIVIEKIQSFGMPVGTEVFETCVWIGKFSERAAHMDIDVKYIYRKDEKMNLCQSMKANDASIKQALVDRFAYGVGNHGKGSKKEKGWFYGFRADVWSAYAVGITYYDMYLKDGE